MDFVIDNYLWFVIGGIILLMIIIGYFAEKTNFGKKPLSEKKPKEETKEVEVPEEVEEPSVTELEDKGLNDILGQPVEEDLTVPMDDLLQVDVEENEIDTLPEVELPEEDLNVPFGDVGVKTEEPEVETPDVPEIIEEEQETDEDDVWKF